MKLTVVTYNMHKGRSFWFRTYKLDVIRAQMDQLTPDILFLQEIHGVHPKRYNSRHSPLESLASQSWPFHCYGRNAVYQKGHHGNALLSQFPIICHHNNDISQSRLATRGLLHAQVQLNGKGTPLHLLNVHLDLFESARQRQADYISSYIADSISEKDKVIMAGDFNDLRNRLDRKLLRHFEKASHQYRKLATFPSSFPRYDLDRIYFRNLSCTNARVVSNRRLRILSDHLPLIVEFSV